MFDKRKVAKALVGMARNIIAGPQHFINRKYGNPQSSAAAILSDIALYGDSSGWSGSEQSFKAVEAILKKFNVVYYDDFNGSWKLK
ncbi:MAG: hypothetical protein II943_03645 [Victivallales bacterium]|nr:hypothetical protein [Victivallales bacterium]